MASARFFATGPFDGEVLPLSSPDVHHAATVLRLKPGEEIAVVGADAVCRFVKLDAVGKDGLTGTVVRTEERPWIPRVTLATALGKGDKTDLVVEKAVELGVEAVVLLQTERTVVRLDARRRTRRVERLERIAQSAARQSGRFEVPRIDGPMSLAAFAADAGFDAVLVAWEEHRGQGIDAALAGCGSDPRVAVVVGPEGGLSEAEVALLTSAGAIPVTLGTTILRTETAGVVATALAIAALGGLGMSRRD